MACSPDMAPCRWAAFQGEHAEDSHFVDLQPDEQVSRGRELLSMLKAPASSRLTQAPSQTPATAPPTPAARSSAKPEPLRASEDEVRMVVKRTFIEFVGPPARPSRPRALSDSALTRGDFSAKSSGNSEAIAEMAEMSEASTDAPSDHEEAAPQPWGAQADGACWAQQQEPFGLAACSADATRMGQVMPAACMTPMMPSDMAAMSGMWMQTGFDESGNFYPYSPVSMDPMMSWQWAYLDPYSGVGEAQTFESPGPTPSAASSCSRGYEVMGATEKEEPKGPKTTVLLRNLPSDFTRAALLELLEDEGFDGGFDFIYLPMDFGAKVCLGYAFVNFVTGSDAQRCWEIFSGYSDWESDKPCEVTWGEPCQGLQAHIERYRNSPVMHKSIPEEWKPLIFKDGVRMPFPAPTKSISAPKLRRRTGRDEQASAASN